MGEKLMSWASYAGAFLSVFTGLTLTEWGILVGILTALLTYATNAYYQRRKDRRDLHLHDLQVQFIYKARQDAQEEALAQVEGGQQ